MRGSILKTSVLVLSVVLAGCGTVPAPFMPNALDGIVAEVVAAARAPAAEQAAALARAEKAAASGTPADRLRLATLLATLGAPLRDDARAGELLQSVTEGSMGRFAALLSSQIAERQRLSREVERVSREAERLGRDAERSAREHDKREEALKQQIEALRAIERNIREREEKLRTRPR
jgi:hypothetical protein